LPPARSLQQTAELPGGSNVTTLLCPQGTFISAVRGLADLQLRALQISCGPGSNSNFTASWGSLGLLGPQPVGTALWAPSDPRNLVPPLVFWFNCDEGFGALRQTPSGAGDASHPLHSLHAHGRIPAHGTSAALTHTGTSGAVSTLAWHCASTGQWTYPNVARASLSPPTAVSNCTALIKSTGLQGQQQRMVGISLGWQPAADGAVSSGTVLFVVHVAES
jgi:hypothetical protein